MPECEKFQQIFHNSVDFDLQKDCHIIVSSSFDNLISPVDIDIPNIKQTLVITKSKFLKCFEVPINFLSNEGIFQLTRTCYSRGRGFLNKNFEKTGMFLYASCMSLDQGFLPVDDTVHSYVLPRYSKVRCRYPLPIVHSYSGSQVIVMEWLLPIVRYLTITCQIPKSVRFRTRIRDHHLPQGTF